MYAGSGRFLAAVAVFSTAAACSSENEKPAPVVCSVTAPAECVDPRPTYADIAPIFSRRCTSCHSETSDGPWPLTSYREVAAWWDVVRDDLIACSMPPQGSGVVMSSEERDEVLMWLRCGFPE